LSSGLKQSLAILTVSVLVGLVSNQMRDEPLPLRGALGPPPVPEQGTSLPAISAEEALTQWESGALFVDVRTKEEWEGARVAGSISMQAQGFPQSYYDIVPPIDSAIPLVVYGSGPDSFAVRRVVAELIDIGHAQVNPAVCGVGGLLAAGVPSEGGAANTSTGSGT
jgi:rhodanese-related sulfurtransferase